MSYRTIAIISLPATRPSVPTGANVLQASEISILPSSGDNPAPKLYDDLPDCCAASKCCSTKTHRSPLERITPLNGNNWPFGASFCSSGNSPTSEEFGIAMDDTLAAAQRILNQFSGTRLAPRYEFDVSCGDGA